MSVQVGAPLFLALLLAHLLGDFLVDPDRVIAGESGPGAGTGTRHGSVHYALAVGSVGLFSGLPLRAVSLASLLAIVAFHLLVDRLDVLAARREWAGERTRFAVDQTVHVVGLLGATAVLPLIGSAPARDPLLAPRPALPILVVYVAVVFAGSEIVRVFLEPFSRRLTREEDSLPGLEDAGRLIGRLERFLVLTALVAGHPSAAGLIIAAKSVYRFPELEDRPFAEYFLIGTLLSIAVAVAGGLVLGAVLSDLAT